MTDDQKSSLIGLLAFGGVGILAVAAQASGCGLPSSTAGIAGIAGLSLPAWWSGFANTTLSALGLNRASEELGKLLKRQKPLTDHLLNEDIHRVVGRAVGAVILRDTRGDAAAEAIGRYAVSSFHKFPWPEQAEFDAVREQGIIDGHLNDLAGIKQRSVLTAAQWETIVEMLNVQAQTAKVLSEPTRRALAERLAKEFAAAFFDLLTADNDPHTRVALEKVTLSLIGTGFSRLIGPVEALDAAFSGILRRPPANLYHLRFEARAYPFTGRHAERRAAFEWLQPAEADPQQDRDFRWAILTGPAGTGKSRFALELGCYAGTQGWEWGFLKRGVDPTHIPLRKPTLIIVDYALDRLEQTVTTLTRYSGEGAHPVRILLLDRLRDDPRLRTLDDDTADVPKDQATKAVWDLGGKDPAEKMMLRHIVVRAYEMQDRIVAADDLDALVAKLVDDARLARPLFAAMAAEAVMAGRQPDDLAPDDLAKWVIQQEFRRWRQVAKTERLPGAQVEALADVMLMATMLGARKGDGVNAAEVGSLQHGRPDQRLLECAATMTRGLQTNPFAMPPIEPDLVGEMYAIQRLSGELSAEGVGPDEACRSARAAADLAWKLDEEAVALFVGRALDDFPGLVHEKEGLGLVPATVKARSGLLAGREAVALIERQDWDALIDHTYGQATYVHGRRMPDWEYWCDSLASSLERVPEVRRPAGLGQRLHTLKGYVDSAVCAYALARAFAVCGDRAEAERLYRAALARDPGYALAMNNLANLLTDLADGKAPGPPQGKTEGDLRAEAERLYRDALARDPGNATAMNNLANLLTDLADGKVPGPPQGKTEGDLRAEAERLYRDALERDPGNAAAMNNLALLLTNLADGKDPGPPPGKTEGDLRAEAERLYRAALERDPGSAMVGLANLLTHLADGRAPGTPPGKTEGDLRAEAERLYRGALERDPGDAIGWANLAWSLFGSTAKATATKEAVAKGLEALGGYASSGVEAALRFLDYALHADAVRLGALRKLVVAGGRALGADVGRVVAHGRAAGHPEATWLVPLAAVITQGADPATLDDWPAWRNVRIG